MSRKPENPLPFPPVIPLFAGVLAISFSAIFIKWCSAPASVIGMYRLAITVVIFLPFAIHRARRVALPSGRDIGLLVLSGVFLGLHFLFWIGSLKHTSVASSMIITTLQPIIVMMGAFLFFRERPVSQALFGLLFAFLGSCIIAGADIHTGQHSWFGDLESFLGTIAVSMYMLVGQQIRSRMPSILYNTVVFFVAAGVLWIFNLAAQIPTTGYGWNDWRWFLLLALVPTVFGHALFNWLLQYISATNISVTVLGEPIGAILLANLLLKEPILWPQWVGGGICLFGVWWFLRVQRRPSVPRQ